MPFVSNRRYKTPCESQFGPPRNALDAYLRHVRMLVCELAERMREAAGSDRWPSAKTVSHWRCGRRPPSKRALAILGQVTAGAISSASWDDPGEPPREHPEPCPKMQSSASSRTG